MGDTSLTATAVQEVAALAKEASVLQTIEAGNHTFTDRPMLRLQSDPSLPTAVDFYTLDGLAGFLEAEPDSNGIIHVVSPTEVRVLGALTGADAHLRPIHARAICQTAQIRGFQFNSYVDMETLAIALQTCFEAKVGRIEELRKFCASVKSTNEIGTADDGVSQTVSAKRGIAAILETPVANPWDLAPWRTFPEIPQPTSSFILRFRYDEEEPAGLFETGDLSWKVDAVKGIAGYLKSKLPATAVVLG